MDVAALALARKYGGGSGGIGPPGQPGLNGWTPVFSVAADGERGVLQISDWTGGQGDKPTTGHYVGQSGFVLTAAEAVNIKGDTGAQGAPGASNDVLYDGAMSAGDNTGAADIDMSSVDWNRYRELRLTVIQPQTPTVAQAVAVGIQGQNGAYKNWLLYSRNISDLEFQLGQDAASFAAVSFQTPPVPFIPVKTDIAIKTLGAFGLVLESETFYSTFAGDGIIQKMYGANTLAVLANITALQIGPVFTGPPPFPAFHAQVKLLGIV